MHKTNKLELAEGMYFDKGSNLIDGICGRPLLCVGITGSRVYYHQYRDNPKIMSEVMTETPEFCSMKSVNFVRQTVEEIEAIRDIQTSMFDEIRESKSEIINRHMSAIDNLGNANAKFKI